MSEEINEDNCVLSDLDIENIDAIFKEYPCKYEGTLETLFLKINKLNDLAKEENK